MKQKKIYKNKRIILFQHQNHPSLIIRYRQAIDSLLEIVVEINKVNRKKKLQNFILFSFCVGTKKERGHK